MTASASATFGDGDPNGTLSDYSATIKWGDGSTTTGTIGTNGSAFTVGGSHAYSKHGTHNIVITITDAGGASAKTTLSITV